MKWGIKLKTNKYAKFIIIFGGILSVAAMTACAVTSITAGRIGNYYLLMGYSRDFALLSRQYIGITVLGALITHIIYTEDE